MAKTSQSPSAGYRIGAVAKLTGISPDKPGVWERCYASVVPERTANDGHLNATEDISRLRLITQLVDSSDNIRAVATLSLEALEAREAQTKMQTFARPTQTRKPIRMAVIGEQLVIGIEAARNTFSVSTPNVSYRDLQSFMNDTSEVAADVLLIE